ncbi:hypothetical protein H4R35_001368 [Dimargaris xerosporica]|nr:hypothetical protein H4R35_001368 [Dimargaris xerosporica]
MTKFTSIVLATAAVAGVMFTSVQADCDAQVVVDECLHNSNNAFNACSPTDYDCRCLAQQAIVECYVNCPDHQDHRGAQGNQQILCGQATAEASRTATKTTATSTSTSESETETETGTKATATKDKDAHTTGDSTDSESDTSSDDGSGASFASISYSVAGMACVVAALAMH